MSESIWKTQASRVFGKGKSFNCTNIVTAKELCSLLNDYEAKAVEHREIYDKLNNIITLLKEVLKELQKVKI